MISALKASVPIQPPQIDPHGPVLLLFAGLELRQAPAAFAGLFPGAAAL